MKKAYILYVAEGQTRTGPTD